MSPIGRFRGMLLALLWTVAAWVRARRPWRITTADLDRWRFHSQTRGRALRMTEWARDRLRPQWLRLRRDS